MRAEFEKTVLEMFETFIASESPLAINIDHDTRTDIIDRCVRVNYFLFCSSLSLLFFLIFGYIIQLQNLLKFRSIVHQV
uniref:RGS domain-containing protein n=1 Tax=Heterorhabditis bacteriophora TaxID=37862 RepID=A0A1I7X0M4_HETBA